MQQTWCEEDHHQARHRRAQGGRAPPPRLGRGVEREGQAGQAGEDPAGAAPPGCPSGPAGGTIRPSSVTIAMSLDPSSRGRRSSACRAGGTCPGGRTARSPSPAAPLQPVGTVRRRIWRVSFTGPRPRRRGRGWRSRGGPGRARLQRVRVGVGDREHDQTRERQPARRRERHRRRGGGPRRARPRPQGQGVGQDPRHGPHGVSPGTNSRAGISVWMMTITSSQPSRGIGRDGADRRLRHLAAGVGRVRIGAGGRSAHGRVHRRGLGPGRWRPASLAAAGI